VTFEQVIQAYKTIVLGTNERTILYGLTTLSVVSLISFYIFLFRNRNSDKHVAELISISIFVLSLCSLLFAIRMIEPKEKIHQKLWVQKYAIPYIESLPKTEIEVEKYHIQNRQENASFFTNKAVDAQTIEVFGTNQKGLPTHYVINAQIQEKEGIRQPRLVFTELKKDLPYRFKKGYYNALLLVPIDRKE
jgi:hypothetical protein